MTERRLPDRFELDLRAVLVEQAPADVPGSLRLRVTEVPFEPERASRGGWLP
jgi:hypothetical protein